MPDYTVDQLLGKLERADAAGDSEAAKAIADEIRRVESSGALAQAQAAPITDLAPVRAEATLEDGVRAVGRSFGLGGRAVMEGIGGTIGMVTDPLTAGLGYLTGTRTSGGRETAGQLADAIGLPSPQTGTERVASGITEAVSGGGGLIGLGRSLVTRAPGIGQAVGTGLAAMPGTQVASAATGAGAAGLTREGGGSPTAQAVAGLAGGFAPSFGRAAVKEGIRRTLRGGETGRQQMEQGVNDFRMLGVEPSVGQATGNRRTQGLESLLAGAPTSGGVMARAAEKQADGIGAGLQAKADGLYRNASSERAGRAVEKGVDIAAGNINATRKALYWQVDQLIPATTQLPLTRTQQVLAELSTPNPGAAASTGLLINPKISSPVGHMSKGGIAENIAADLATARAAGGVGLPYSAVKDIRTRIGEQLSDFSLSTDKPTAEYKRLYAALSQDLEEAARNQGPAAAQAAKRANSYFKASADRLENLQRVVDKNGGPEKVYAAVMSGTQDGGTTLRAVMQSLDKPGQKAMTGAVLKRMGMATKGQQNADGDAFSSATFLTNWNGISKESKRALFDRHGPKFVADMDRVARVASRIKDGSKVFANPSGTGNRVAAYTYAGSLLTATAAAPFTGALPLAGLILSGIGANVAARAMTNPRFVSALARSTEMPVSALPQFILQLKRQAEITKDDELAEIADGLEQGQQAQSEQP